MPNQLDSSQTSAKLTLSGAPNIITLASQDGNFQGSVSKYKTTTAGVGGITKWYWEVIATVANAANWQVGIANASAGVTDAYIGKDTNGLSEANGQWFYNATGSGAPPGGVTNNAYGIAWDCANGLLWIRDIVAGGNFEGSGDSGVAPPTAPTTNGQAVNSTVCSGTTAAGPAIGVGNSATNGDSITLRYTAASFTGTVPTGYSAADLMAPTAVSVWLLTH